MQIIFINLYFNIILLYTLSYILNCKIQFKNILLGSVIGAYRIFISFPLFDILMILITFKNKKALIHYLFLCLILKGLNYNIFTSTIFLLIYIYINKKEEYVNVEITTEFETINVKGFLDSGNKLEKFNKPILILNKKRLTNFSIKYFSFYETIDSNGMIPIINIKQIRINKRIIKNVLVGIIEMDKIDLILNPKIMEET